MSELYLPDSAEGRAVEQVVAGLSLGRYPGQLAMARRLARIALGVMVELIGAEDAAAFFVGLSGDALRMRGRGKGAKRR